MATRTDDRTASAVVEEPETTSFQDRLDRDLEERASRFLRNLATGLDHLEVEARGGTVVVRGHLPSTNR